MPSARNFSRQEYEHMIGAGILGEDEHVELIGGFYAMRSELAIPFASSIH